MLRESIE